MSNGGEAKLAARSAGLRYVSDEIVPGITRHGAPGHFHYRSPGGKPVRDKATLRRIHALAIPPAWKDVWIAPFANAHLMATGRDARGRKQYRYHADFAAVRDGDKYARLPEFAASLPALRRRLKRDQARPGLPREKILATIVSLLEQTLIRIGNEDYARNNHSFGLTTLRNRHVRIRGPELRFLFRGKSGKQWSLSVRDRRVARVIRSCQELPGQHLFEYRDSDGTVRPVSSSDVNAYLREITGADISAKDFRTWAGTVKAAMAFQAAPEKVRKKTARLIVATVAEELGNTAAVCRKCYIHPDILAAIEAADLVLPVPRRKPQGFRSAEYAVLNLSSAAESHRNVSKCLKCLFWMRHGAQWIYSVYGIYREFCLFVRCRSPKRGAIKGSHFYAALQYDQNTELCLLKFCDHAQGECSFGPAVHS